MIRWTDEMKRVIKDNYPQKTYKELAELLGVTRAAINRQIIKLGLSGLAKPLNRKPVLKVDLCGNVITRYNSVLDAAKENHCGHAAMIYRIRSGCIINNKIMFRFERPEDEDFDIREWGCKRKKTKEAYKELDASKYRILSYEVRNQVECITPCPFREHPRPMIGSAGCMKCSSFKGKDSINHQIACNKHYI